LTTTTDGFIKLFQGRTDAYGTWDGGANRSVVTRNHYEQHLAGTRLIGIYPSVGLGEFTKVRWGCSDIDYKGTDDHWRLSQALEHVGIPTWVEETVRGYHVWVFADTFVRASTMRDCFLAAHQVIDLPPKEVNPKQTRLQVGELGNYVRLPYPGGRTERRMIWSEGEHYPLEDFVDQALATLADRDNIAYVAARYDPPPMPVVVNLNPEGLEAALGQLNKLGCWIWNHGVLDGKDRSTTLAHLAHECAKSGVSPADAYLIIESADHKWGQKFVNRKDGGRKELSGLVSLAYGRAASTSIAPHE